MALSLFKLAERQGHAGAAVAIGEMYEKGEGCKADPAVAYMMYRKAAGRGSDEGDFHLGMMYRDGVGVKADPDIAAVFFRKSGRKDVAPVEDLRKGGRP